MTPIEEDAVFTQCWLLSGPFAAVRGQQVEVRTVYRQSLCLCFFISRIAMRDLEALAQEFAMYRDALHYAKRREALERWRKGERTELNVSSIPTRKGKTN
jgi:hypothetical protein